jgi:hypothetical protein
MMEDFFSIGTAAETRCGTNVVDTTLYALIAAVSDEIEPGEEHLVARVVSRILDEAQLPRPADRLESSVRRLEMAKMEAA